jgi:uncharacterized membrane protein
MQTNWRNEALQLIVIVGMFCAAAVLWTRVPQRMAVHWNLAGQPDRFGTNFEGLLLTPLIALGVYVLLLVLPRIDPRGSAYGAFARGYAMVRLATLCLLAAIYAMIVRVALGYNVDIGLLVPLGVGILFCIIGNFMPKFRQNWFVGVRTPWTLASSASWNKTNRMAGRLFIVTGIALFLLAFVQSAWTLWLVLGMVAVMVLWLPMYSYLIWRNDPERLRAADSGT